MRPGDPAPAIANSGSRRFASQMTENSSAMRVSIAKPKPDDARAAALRRRQTVDQQGEEDDVVDAENDLEHRKREEGHPRLRLEE